MQKINSRKIFTVILSTLCAVILACSVLSYAGSGNLNAKAAMDVTTNAEVVGELAKNYTAGSWDGEFDNSNLGMLYSAISGTGNKYSDLVKALSNSTSTESITGAKVITASDLANVSTHSGKDIVVTLGGLQWTVVYVSNELTNNDIIATLLLADDLKTNGSSGTVVSSPFSSWSVANLNSSTSKYPGNMYSTSDIRSVLIGTRYSTNASTLSTAEQGTAKQNAVIKSFLSDFGGAGGYLVQPINVGWQERESSQPVTGSWTQNSSNKAYANCRQFNDAWGSGLPIMLRNHIT